MYHYSGALEGQKLLEMQLDADRYPLLYSIRGALSPARKNAKAARQAAAKRRAWTAEYSQLVFSLIDARR